MFLTKYYKIHGHNTFSKRKSVLSTDKQEWREMLNSELKFPICHYSFSEFVLRFTYF